MNRWRRQFAKLKGAFGITDYDNKVIKIDKSKHNPKSIAEYKIPKKDKSMLNTMVHEEMHVAHPKMTEKAVQKQTRAKVGRMSQKQKNKVYKRYEKA